MSRGGKVNRLTIEERKGIEDCLKKKLTNKEIASFVGRPINTIRNEICRNGGRSFYSYEKSQTKSDTSNERRIESLKKWIATNKPKLTHGAIRKRQRRISERLAIVEEKLNLLIKIIKEKNGSSFNKRLLDI